MSLEMELNKETITSFPVDEALPNRKPGVYVMTAVAPGSRAEEWDAKATQWFVVSDIGLSSFAGVDGLTVFARSLGTAKPMEGVSLKLLAKNNDLLGESITDAIGAHKHEGKRQVGHGVGGAVTRQCCCMDGFARTVHAALGVGINIQRAG